MSACMQLVKKRAIKSFCSLLIIGSVVGCAVDNYIAVCRPFYHRFQSKKLANCFTCFFLIYAGLGIFCCSFDIMRPLVTHENCIDTVFAQRFTIENYCLAAEDCLDKKPLMEVFLLVIWLVSAGIVCFSYISVVFVLRNSMKTIEREASKTFIPHRNNTFRRVKSMVVKNRNSSTSTDNKSTDKIKLPKLASLESSPSVYSKKKRLASNASMAMHFRNRRRTS